MAGLWDLPNSYFLNESASSLGEEEDEYGFFKGIRSGLIGQRKQAAGFFAPWSESARETTEELGEKQRELAVNRPDWRDDIWGNFKATLGENLPQLGTVAGAAKAAQLLARAMPAATPLTLAIKVGAGLIGGGLALAVQFQGENISRQLEEGQEPDALKALAATVPQVASEALFLRTLGFIPGAKNLFKWTTGKFGERVAKRVGGALLAGVSTEVVQQALERAQAGLEVDPFTNEDAYIEYLDSAVGAAMLSGALGAISGIPRAKEDKGKDKEKVLKDDLLSKPEAPDYVETQNVRPLTLTLEDARDTLRRKGVDPDGIADDAAFKMSDVIKRRELEEQARLDAIKDITKERTEGEATQEVRDVIKSMPEGPLAPEGTTYQLTGGFALLYDAKNKPKQLVVNSLEGAKWVFDRFSVPGEYDALGAPKQMLAANRIIKDVGLTLSDVIKENPEVAPIVTGRFKNFSVTSEVDTKSNTVEENVKVLNEEGAEKLLRHLTPDLDIAKIKADEKIKLAQKAISKLKLTGDFLRKNLPDEFVHYREEETQKGSESITTEEDTYALGHYKKAANLKAEEERQALLSERRVRAEEGTREALEASKETFTTAPKGDVQKQVEGIQETIGKKEPPTYNIKLDQYLNEVPAGKVLSMTRVQEALNNTTRQNAKEVLDHLSETGVLKKLPDGRYERTKYTPFSDKRPLRYPSITLDNRNKIKEKGVSDPEEVLERALGKKALEKLVYSYGPLKMSEEEKVRFIALIQDYDTVGLSGEVALGTGKLTLNSTLSPRQMTFTMYHEMSHLADLLNVYTQEEWATLNDPKWRPRIRRFFKSVPNDELESGYLDNPDLFDEMISNDQERTAVLTQVYGYYKETVTKPKYNLPDTLRNILDKVLDFFKKLADAGYKTPFSITKDLIEGKMASRPFKLPSFIPGRLPSIEGSEKEAAVKMGNTEKKLTKAPDGVSSFLEKINLYWRYFGDLNSLADRYPALRRTRDLQMAVMEDRAKLLNTTFNHFYPLSNLRKEQQRAAQDTLFWMDKNETEVVPSGLDSETASAVADVRTGINHLFDEIIGAAEKYFDDLQERAKAVALLRAARKPGYLPHIRTGNMGITVKDKEGTRLHFETFYKSIFGGWKGLLWKKLDTTNKRALEIKERLTKEYPDATVSSAFELSYDDVKKAYGSKAWSELGYLERLANTLGVIEAPKYQRMMPTGKVRNVLEDFFTEMKQEVTKRGFRVHMKQRKNIPGWLNENNKDYYLREALASYGARSAHYIARLNYQRALLDEVSRLGNEAPAIQEIADGFVKYSNSPDEEHAWLTSLTFHWMLGANLSSALVNLTQLATATLPHLSGYMSPFAAVRYLGKGMKDAAKMVAVTQLTEGGINWNVKPDSIKEDEWHALKTAQERGLLLPQNIRDLAGIGATGGAFSPEISRALKNPAAEKVATSTLEVSALAFNVVESLNRISTFLGVYRAAKSNPKILERAKRMYLGTALEGKISSPYDLAEAAVGRTHGIFGREMRPQVMRNFMRVPTQFMQFPLMMLNQWILAYNTYGGGGARGGGEGKVEARRMLGMLVLGTALFSGAQGLPFAETLRTLLLKFAGYNLDREMRNTLADVFDNTGMSGLLQAMGLGREALADAVVSGAPRSILGIDMSRRTALDVLPRWINSWQASFDELIWPSGAVLFGSVRGMVEYLNQGKTTLAIGEMLPVALKNIIKAYDAKDKGYFTRKGPRLTQAIDDVDFVKQFVGFTPTTAAYARERVRAAELFNTAGYPKKEEFTEKAHYYKLMSELLSRKGDTAGARSYQKEYEDILLKARKWDAKQTEPERRVNLNLKTINERVEQSLKGLASESVLKKKTSKKLRGSLDEALRGYPS